MKETKLALFEWKEIRKVWNVEKWDWLFSVVDVIEVLTESEDSRNYWKVLKHRLIKEWSIETVTKKSVKGDEMLQKMQSYK